jgi:hypothetical protein
MPPIGLLLNDCLLVCNLECHRVFLAGYGIARGNSQVDRLCFSLQAV